jgi:hypothetical protein
MDESTELNDAQRGKAGRSAAWLHAEQVAS